MPPVDIPPYPPRFGSEFNLVSISRRLALRAAEPFWQARYCDFNVWSERKFVEKLRYIHRNPVTRGLVARPEDWRWSSFRHYATGEASAVEIESQWTARAREKAGIFPTVRRALMSTPPAQAELGRGTLPRGLARHNHR